MPVSVGAAPLIAAICRELQIARTVNSILNPANHKYLTSGYLKYMGRRKSLSRPKFLGIQYLLISSQKGGSSSSTRLTYFGKWSLNINKKKVYRLCKEMGILMPQRKPKPKRPRRIARNRLVDGVNQLWDTDIEYGYIAGEKRFFFVQAIIDVYDRMIVNYHIGLRCTGKDAAAALRSAYDRRRDELSGAKPTIRTDNGPQFTSEVFAEACRQEDLEHELIPVRMPNKNAHIEAFHSLLEKDCLIKYSKRYAKG